MTKRQQRIEQIVKLEAKQKKKWFADVQERIDRLKILTSWNGTVNEDERAPQEMSSEQGGFYMEPVKRKAGEYAAYLGSAKL